jgi:DNA-binding response OmpR family regulator
MKVLVIEDELGIALGIEKGFQQEKWLVERAETGTDGLDKALIGQYDVIVMDLMLPGIDGLSICRELRVNNVQTPVLMLTAKSMTEDKLMGFETGADDYLTKPFSFDELVARVKALSRRPTQISPELLKAGTLELNSNLHQVSRSGAAIELTAKEYLVLEFLLRHPNQVISKHQLIEHAWEYDTDVLDNTVEVLIKNMRRKIDDPFPKETPLIKTVRGFGYKLEV